MNKFSSLIQLVASFMNAVKMQNVISFLLTGEKDTPWQASKTFSQFFK
jgi:hypothetical protein